MTTVQVKYLHGFILIVNEHDIKHFITVQAILKFYNFLKSIFFLITA